MLEWLFADRGRTWVVSALVGVLAAPLLALGGLWGALLFGWLAVYLWYGRSRVHAASGMLTGFGAAWLVAFVMMFNMARAIDVALWLGVGLGAIVLGVGLLVAWTNTAGAGRRTRRMHAMSREESISYFRDLSGRSGPGVQEEESVGRWGGRNG